MVLVRGSRHCHFPSSAAAITWQRSAESIHRDKTALCLHTKFNRGSPHLHRRARGGGSGKRFGGRRDLKMENFVNRRSSFKGKRENYECGENALS